MYGKQKVKINVWILTIIRNQNLVMNVFRGGGGVPHRKSYIFQLVKDRLRPHNFKAHYIIFRVESPKIFIVPRVLE